MDKSFLQVPRWMATLPFVRKFALAAATSIQNVKPLSNGDKKIISLITQEFRDNCARDMQDWRESNIIAEDPINPRWCYLQDLYDYLEPDAQLGTSKEIRVATTLGKPFMVRSKKTKLENPEKTGLLKNKEWFFNFCWNMIDTVFYKTTAAQLVNPATMEFDYLPRRNIVPNKDFFLFSVFGDIGYSLKDPALKDSVIYIKYKHRFGILNDIVPNLIWKKNARIAWAEFAEKFGIPPIWATTNKTDTKTLDRIETMLKSLAEAATAVLPEGTVVTVDQTTQRGDPYNVYLQQVNLDDEQIAKRLLGGTMITDSGSSLSQSEVHERTLKEIITLFDSNMLLFVVNGYLLPLMAKNGYPFTDDDEFVFDDSENLSLTQLWSIVQGMLNYFEIPPNWISEKFKIPIDGVKQNPFLFSGDTGNNDGNTSTDNPPKPGNGAPEPGAPGNGKPGATVKPGKVSPRKGAANFQKPADALALALAGKGVHLPRYESRVCSHCGGIARTPVAEDSSNKRPDLSELSDLLITDVWNKNPTLINEVLKTIETYSFFRDGLFDAWGNRMKIRYDSPDIQALSAMEYNLFEFSRMKEKANVIALNHLLVNRDDNNVRTFKDFRDNALQYLQNPDVNWLNTEYNFTKATAQNASRYYSFWNEKNDYPILRYQTVGDNRVRPAHALLNGKLFRINDPQARLIWPPNGYNCRCEFLQETGQVANKDVASGADAMKTLGFKEGDPFAINRGEAKQVFTRNEQYVQSNGLASELNKVTFADYKLKPVDDMTGLPPLKLDDTITADNAGELFKPLPYEVSGKQAMGFQDYLGRKMVLNKDMFDYHMQGKYTNSSEQRDKLFPHIADILKSPDEVYFSKYEGKPGKPQFQTNYIKFFEGQPVIVNTGINGSTVTVNTWYKAKVKEANYRKGYLIKA